MSLDPVVSNADHYKVVFENERVRVLEYIDAPGDKTTAHEHPNSVMYTLSSFRRRLHSGDGHRDVEMPAGTAGWLPAQRHYGENIGDTQTHVIFVELKTESAVAPTEGHSGQVELAASQADGAGGAAVPDFERIIEAPVRHSPGPRPTSPAADHLVVAERAAAATPRPRPRPRPQGDRLPGKIAPPGPAG